MNLKVCLALRLPFHIALIWQATQDIQSVLTAKFFCLGNRDAIRAYPAAPRFVLTLIA